jgi:hypothetical protein
MCTQSPLKRIINKAPRTVPLLEGYVEYIIIVANHAPHGCHVFFVIN